MDHSVQTQGNCHIGFPQTRLSQIPLKDWRLLKSQECPCLFTDWPSDWHDIILWDTIYVPLEYSLSSSAYYTVPPQFWYLPSSSKLLTKVLLLYNFIHLLHLTYICNIHFQYVRMYENIFWREIHNLISMPMPVPVKNMLQLETMISSPIPTNMQDNYLS